MILIEIKSKDKVLSRDLKSLKSVRAAIDSKAEFLLCLEKRARKENGIRIIHWQEGLKKIFKHSGLYRPSL